jgi:hypothetical protein
VARMGEERNVYRFWRENQKERDHLEDWVVDGEDSQILWRKQSFVS